MANDRLFGNNIQPACKYCTEGFYKPGEEQVLCIKRGVTTPDFHCKKFDYDPLKRSPERPQTPIKPTEAEMDIGSPPSSKGGDGSDM